MGISETRSMAPGHRPAAPPRRHRTPRQSPSQGSGIGPASASSAAASISALISDRSASMSTPEHTQPVLLALDRVALAPLLDLLLGHVLHVVVGGVAVHAHRHRLDQRRPLAGQRPLARGARRLEHRLDVVAVDGHPDEPVGGGPLDRVDRELLVQRRRIRVLVVLQDEHHRQLLHAGPVHRLVEVAARGRAVAEPGHRAAALAAQLERHRHAGGDQHHVGQHRDHPDAAELAVAEVDVAVAPAGDPGGAAHVLREDPRRRDAADQVRGEVPVQDAQPVARSHRERRAGRHRLLPIAVVERPGDLALAVQGHRALFQAAHQQHRAQQPDAILQRQVLDRRRPAGSRLSRMSGHLSSFPFSVGRIGISASGPGSPSHPGSPGQALYLGPFEFIGESAWLRAGWAGGGGLPLDRWTAPGCRTRAPASCGCAGGGPAPGCGPRSSCSPSPTR